jgi:ribosomal protein S18 acetylase RimI-like enzyme
MRERLDVPGGRRPEIRRGGPADVDFIRAVAETVFAPLGDYGRILPGWLVHEGVLTHIAELDAEPLGYTMLGFYPVTRGEYVADLLAIAVASPHQGLGLGRQLLEHAIVQARAARRRLPVREMRLSVADTNARARRLFVHHGFRLMQGDHGRYDGGQIALHMSRKL